jgi:hypothetical protein
LKVGIFFAVALLYALNAQAQQVSDQKGSDLIVEIPFHWISDPGLFLEPNRFSIVKEVQDRPLWLEIGFGRPVIVFQTAEKDDIKIGLEALAWSRLTTLSDFRFPVQTVDYFFGAYVIWDHNDYETAQSKGISMSGDSWRLRLGHISSHLVDGTDSTITGGASSEYSREFVELMRQVDVFDDPDRLLTIGVRCYFHQVTKIEPWIAFPAALSWRVDPFTYNSNNKIFAFLSSGDGPVWPTGTAGLRFEQRVRSSTGQSSMGIQLYYQYGASWAGTDAGAKHSSINLQLDVRDF